MPRVDPSRLPKLLELLMAAGRSIAWDRKPTLITGDRDFTAVEYEIRNRTYAGARD